MKVREVGHILLLSLCCQAAATPVLGIPSHILPVYEPAKSLWHKWQTPTPRSPEHRIISKSQNHLGWKRPLRLSSPTFDLALPCPPLKHVTKPYIFMFFNDLQGWWLNYFPWQPVPILHNSFREEIILNIKPKPLLAQLKAISSCLITWYFEKRLIPTSL